MHLAHFDALYAAEDDPWDAHSSRDEAFKRRMIGYALGGAVLSSGLEIGCGNGFSTLALTKHFLRLLAIDGSAAAIAFAAKRVLFCPRISVKRQVLPGDLPSNRFDAIIASEVLYYLPKNELDNILRIARAALRPNGLFISTHHLKRFSDAECGHRTLVQKTRNIFGREHRQLIGFGWRCYVHRAR